MPANLIRFNYCLTHCLSVAYKKIVPIQCEAQYPSPSGEGVSHLGFAGFLVR